MKQYVTITELEFDALLKADKGWVKTFEFGEFVYSYTLKKNPDVKVKVFSSISNGASKPCGKDAIRVCAINMVTQKGILKSKRVNRVPGWDVRVKERVIETIENIFPKRK
jgi:hypothetical protein